MSAQPSPPLLSLKTAATALAVSMVVFLSGNLLIYLVLYPPVIAAPVEPAPVTQPVTQPIVQPTAAQNTDTGTQFTSMNGDWVRENGVITQRSLDTRDFMTASGIQGERYIMSVSVTLPTTDQVPEAGGGLVFHMVQRDSLAGSEMVRFHLNGQEILWGSYDDAGTFQYQGGQPIPQSGSQTRQLTLIVRGDRFDILVDDQVIQQDLPLQAGSGYIGLISYRGNVSFANFRLTIGAGS
ncbi:MAG: hypothetical protein U0670_13740 [Anaerolineae bacterium]